MGEDGEGGGEWGRMERVGVSKVGMERLGWAEHFEKSKMGIKRIDAGINAKKKVISRGILW